MKSTSVASGAIRDPAGLPTDKKRKRSFKQSSPATDRLANPKQQNIHDLFSTQGKPSAGSRTHTETSPESKRTRPESRTSDPPLVAAVSSRPLDKMYTFASKQPNGHIVDLTKSPPRNGQMRKPSGGKATVTMNPHQGARKLVVKNLRKESTWDTDKYLEQVWAELGSALTTIYTAKKPTFSMEDLYRGVENVCKQGKAKTIYDRLHERCTKHLRQDVLPSMQHGKSQDNIATLRAVLDAWASWSSQITMIRCIFYYMDRSYLLQHSKTTLNDVCVQLFRDIIFNDDVLKPRIIDGACDLVSADRTTQTTDKATLRHAISMFHDLAIYASSFEPRLLALSQTYIVRWADTTCQENELPDYVAAANTLMRRELDRCDEFGLDRSTSSHLVNLLEAHLVERQAEYLTAAPAVAALLDVNAVDSLTQLYAMLRRKKLEARLKAPFSSWVENTGTDIIFDDKALDEMVVRLLSLKRRLDNIWRTSFQRDDDLGHGLREAFETFINKTKKGQATWGTDNSKAGEMIAKYVDTLLRDGFKAIPSELAAGKADVAANEQDDDDDRAADEDTEVNAQLDQVLDLFRFVHGKAVFEAFYKKDLAKRLLMGRSASADAERSMLTRLKTECGAGFTQNLEQMFRDIELGREEMSSYKDRLDEMQKKPGEIDINVNVLSAAAWPTYPEVPVRIPAVVNIAIDEFEKHYKGKHSGRRLTWKHALAHCQMKATFPKGSKEFVVSAFQAIVLLLFNGLAKDDYLTYEYIVEESGLSEAEVKRTLQSLACAKLRPLRKEPQGKDINAEDKFTVNQTFSHPKYRVRINQVQLKETKQENKETHERVAEDRNFECQAAIVRIMKSRKTIGHSELVAEVITATRSRGVLGVSDIKKNIDRLIEKDYMEREEGNKYNYVA